MAPSQLREWTDSDNSHKLSCILQHMCPKSFVGESMTTALIVSHYEAYICVNYSLPQCRILIDTLLCVRQTEWVYKQRPTITKYNRFALKFEFGNPLFMRIFAGLELHPNHYMIYTQEA